MKEYILAFKESQELIEWRESDLNGALCKEIDMYRQLRIKWFIGHIECRCYFYNGCPCKPRCMYMLIFGHYWNVLGVKSKTFLDFTFENALAYCDVTKHQTWYQTRADHCLNVLSMY